MKSRLNPNDIQSTNKSAFAKVKQKEFDVQVDSKRAEELAKRIKDLTADINNEERYIEDLYKEKDDIFRKEEKLDSNFREMERQKESLNVDLERKKEELRMLRMTGFDPQDRQNNEEIEREIELTDNLLRVKLDELRREKEKFDSLKLKYESYLMGEDSKRQDKKRNSNASSHMMSQLGYDDKKSLLLSSGMDPSQIRMQQRPSSMKTELKESPSSRFLDEFNRDIEKLIYKC